METRSKEIKARNESRVVMIVTPGHFATRNSHINYYVNMTKIKSMHSVAKLAARELAVQYAQMTPIEAIVCMDGTEVLAAYLAEALSDGESRAINTGSSIAIVTPEINISGQLMFRDNVQSMIWNHNVLLLAASATTGATISQAMECINYYNGRISGICAVFSAIPKIGDITIHSIFNTDDVPGYATYSPVDCPDCQAKRKIDALVNSFGYSKL